MKQKSNSATNIYCVYVVYPWNPSVYVFKIHCNILLVLFTDHWIGQLPLSLSDIGLFKLCLKMPGLLPQPKLTLYVTKILRQTQTFPLHHYIKSKVNHKEKKEIEVDQKKAEQIPFLRY